MRTFLGAMVMGVVFAFAMIFISMDRKPAEAAHRNYVAEEGCWTRLKCQRSIERLLRAQTCLMAHWQANANRTGLSAGERRYSREMWESMGCEFLPAAIEGEGEGG